MRFALFLCVAMALAGCVTTLPAGPSAAEILREEQLSYDAWAMRVHEQQGIPGPFRPRSVEDVRCRATGPNRILCSYLMRVDARSVPERVTDREFTRSADRWRMKDDRPVLI